MSVIQSIREKYAKWAVIAIALALLGFILTDYFQAKNRMGRGNSSTLGTVNGKKIDYISFETKLKARDDQQQAAAATAATGIYRSTKTANSRSIVEPGSGRDHNDIPNLKKSELMLEKKNLMITCLDKILPRN